MRMRNRSQPLVGVGVVIVRDGKVLLGKRRGSHGDGSWSFVGGHIEANESVEGCAAREALEEAGIKIANIRYATFTDDYFSKEGTRYVTLFAVADYSSGTVRVMEPEKCERWEWFAWDALPSPLFLPIENLLKQGFNPFKE